MTLIKRTRMSLIRDPLHNYIPFTVGSESEPGESDILDSRWMQRLRRIYQLQAAWLVYPGATHTRFLHSLGTMQLAGRFADHLYRSFVEIHGKNAIPERDYVIEVLRLAGLLHDIGHSTFGHSFDQIYSHKHYGKTHEDVGRKIVTEELGDLIRALRCSPEGSFEQPIEPEIVARFIKPDLETEESLPLWEQIFAKIIHGLYSADTMDYLARDAHFCGTSEYGIVDVDRLILSSTVTEAGLTLHSSTVPALKSFLFSRLMMYENVYYHKTVRAYDMAFCELLSRALELMELGNPVENLEKLYPLDDMNLYTLLASWKNSDEKEKRAIGAAWSDLMARRNPWKEAFHRVVGREKLSLRPDMVIQSIEQELKKALPSGIPIRVDMPYLDVRPKNPLAPAWRKKAVAVYDPITGGVDQKGLESLIADLPVKFLVLRVFCPARHKAEVYKAARTILPEDEIEYQESSF